MKLRVQRIRRAALWSGCFALGLVALYAAIVATPSGQALDAPTLGAFAWSSPVGDVVGQARTPLAVVLCLAAGALIVHAVFRGRRSLAAWCAAALVGSQVMTVVLRDVVLIRPLYGDEFGHPVNTFPSGHAAVSLVAAAVILVLLPAPWVGSTVVGLVGAAAAVVAVGSVSSYAHRGSDVIGGALLAGAIVAWLPSSSSLRWLRLSDERWLWLGAVLGGAVLLRFLAASAGVPGIVDAAVSIATAGAVVAVTAAVLATTVPDGSRVFP